MALDSDSSARIRRLILAPCINHDTGRGQFDDHRCDTLRGPTRRQTVVLNKSGGNAFGEGRGLSLRLEKPRCPTGGLRLQTSAFMPPHCCHAQKSPTGVRLARRERIGKLPVTDRGSFRGVTQFAACKSRVRRNPLNLNGIYGRTHATATCAIISRDRRQVVDSKDGEILERSIRHARKTNPRCSLSDTERRFAQSIQRLAATECCSM